MEATSRITAGALALSVLLSIAIVPGAVGNHGDGLTASFTTNPVFSNGATFPVGTTLTFTDTSPAHSGPGCAPVVERWVVTNETAVDAAANPQINVIGASTGIFTVNRTRELVCPSGQHSKTVWDSISFEFVVPSVTLSSIAISPTPSAILADATETFSATGTYSDASTAPITPTWERSCTPAGGSITAAGLFTAPSGEAECTVYANLTGVSGSHTFDIVTTPPPPPPVVLVSIDVSPTPASLVVGTTETFSATGTYSDASTTAVTPTWERSCTPAGGSITAAGLFTAPTEVGECSVHANLTGVTGSVSFDVVAGALDSISVTGVLEIDVGATETYDLDGFDAFDNPVALAEASLDFTAPTAAGPTDVCYTESGVTGCLTVDVLPGPMTTFWLATTGGTLSPAAFGAETVVSFKGFGRDAFNNVVDLELVDGVIAPVSGSSCTADWWSADLDNDIFAILTGPAGEVCEVTIWAEDLVHGDVLDATFVFATVEFETLALSFDGIVRANTPTSFTVQALDSFGNPVEVEIDLSTDCGTIVGGVLIPAHRGTCTVTATVGDLVQTFTFQVHARLVGGGSGPEQFLEPASRPTSSPSAPTPPPAPAGEDDAPPAPPTPPPVPEPVGEPLAPASTNPLVEEALPEEDGTASAGTVDEENDTPALGAALVVLALLGLARVVRRK